MILRELLFKLGIDFNSEGSKQAESSVDRLTSGFQALGGVIAAAGAFKLFQGFIEDASKLEETIIRTKAVFGDAGEEAVAWADQVAAGLGVGTGTLLKSTAQFGLIANGYGLTGDAAADMSKGLAEAALNMAAFNGLSEEEAANAIRSGLLGMDRTIKQYGVSVNDAALQEFAQAKGIRKKVKDMTEQEKVLLRYQKIRAGLAKTDGAAAKSLERYAGASKALSEALADTSEAFGGGLTFGAAKALNAIREVVLWFNKLITNTHIAQAALIGVSFIIGSMLWPHLVRLLVVGVPLVAVFAAFALVIDDVIAAFSGGNSVLLGFAKWLDKIQNENFPGWTAWFKGIISPVNALRDALGAIALLTFEGVNALLTGDFSVFKATASAIADSLISWVKSFELVAFFINTIKGSLGFFAQGVKTELGMLSQIGSSIGGLAGGSLGAPSAPSAAPPKTSNKTFNMTINQQPGEDTEFFARRVSEEIDKRDAAKDEALYYEFLPQGAQ